ncbi:MAG: C45 family peptidase [Eubacteriales bacterium]|nr:C45 family peptidase [Eubacteriales bacterium]
MNRRFFALALAGLSLTLWIIGCGKANEAMQPPSSEAARQEQAVVLTSAITELEEGFSVVKYEGDDGFDTFLTAGGASSDREVVSFLSNRLGTELDILGGLFGCSTIAVSDPMGARLFGRNFDWQNCEALVVASKPEKGYASISTVNMDFISQSGGAIRAALRLDEVRTMAALYAPLDGMNEKGLAVSVNMIEDADTIDQNTDKPDLTTTTAIRLLLNKAADVDEALDLLGQYDMHASMGMMVHFALADTSGRSVAVEYVDNEMVVTETPVVTNFYLAEGEKNGVGTSQSHERYDILTRLLREQPTMDADAVRDALSGVSKRNFGEFESTEWSIVFDLGGGTARYYHRENYQNSYLFQLS